MMRAIVYELNPTKSQAHFMNKTLGCCRFVYNRALDLRIKAYNERQENISGFDIMKMLPQWKKDLPWLKEVCAAQLQQSIANLDAAFTNFFKGHKKFPKFKSKHDKQSFRIPQNVKVDYEKFCFWVPKTGWVKFYKDKQINGKIKFATVSKTPTGRYFVTITYETEKITKKVEGVVGIDLGLKKFAVTSDGQVFENQKYLRTNLKKLRREKRKLDRKFKVRAPEQSKNWYKQKLIVAKLHEKIVNQRKDFLHKISSELCNRYQTICIEDLNIVGMVKNRKLALSIHDCGWGDFCRMLGYKCEDVRIINRFDPSSQVCSVCGYRNKELKLSDRDWTCENGHKLDRDLNAAINIKNYGLRASTFDGNVVH